MAQPSSQLTLYDSTSPHTRARCSKVPRVTQSTVQFILALDALRAQRCVGGLSAPQVGVRQRILVIHDGDDHFAAVNPVITALSGDVITELEGCLSLFNIFGDVPRAATVMLTATILHLSDGYHRRMHRFGQPLKLELTGSIARAVQHEVDHLNGVLFIDRMPINAPLKSFAASAGASQPPTIASLTARGWGIAGGINKSDE